MADLADIERRLRLLEAGFDHRTYERVEAGRREFTDGDGVVRIREGLQTDGSYDIAMFDPADTSGGSFITLTKLAFGLQVDYQPGTVTITSTSWQDLGGPVFDAEVGATGRVLAIGGAFLTATSAAATSATVGVSVDGANPTVILANLSAGASSGVGATVTGLQEISGLARGPHRFCLWYTRATSDAYASERSLAIWPL